MAAFPRTSVAGKYILGFEGTSLPGELRALLEQGLAGVAIFHRNFTSLDRLCRLTSEIRQAAGRPVLVGIDQEGGTAFALKEPFTVWPTPAELGLLDDASLVERVARAIARELRAVGCNLNFAPMLDLAVNPTSPVTVGRSFGADPKKVARLGTAFIRGLQAEGVLACAKHYPGHGDTSIDPHEDLPVFHGTAERLHQVELLPFADAVAAGVPLIMTAHILLPRMDPERPASLSRLLLTKTLRERLGFGGVILADDLGMGAIAKRLGPGEAAVETFRAGSDLAMLCHDWSAVPPALEAVEKARARGRFDESEWRASHTRIERLQATLRSRSFGSDKEPSGKTGASAPEEVPLDVVGCTEHRVLADEIRAQVARFARSE